MNSIIIQDYGDFVERKNKYKEAEFLKQPFPHTTVETSEMAGGLRYTLSLFVFPCNSLLPVLIKCTVFPACA